MPWSWQYKSDLSNEVLYPLVGEEAAKISEVKVRGGKEIANSARFKTDAPKAYRYYKVRFYPLCMNRSYNHPCSSD